MRKHHESNDFEEVNNTYRTGHTPKQRSSSGLIAFLLALTIFLGGLASALGLLNIRLLQALMEKPQSNSPVDVLTQPPGSHATVGSSVATEPDLPLPELPEQRDPQLQLQDIQSQMNQPLTNHNILRPNQNSLVTVQCGQSSFTGLVLSADGYILTNAHLLECDNRYYVIGPDGSCFRAALVGYDILTDLAVLYIQGASLTPIRFANTSQLLMNTPVASISQEKTLVAGSIAVTRKAVTLGQHPLQLLQTTLPSENGPIFNSQGQVIGIGSKQVEQLLGLEPGHGIPSTTVTEVAQALIRQGFVEGRPTLGLRTQPVSALYQEYWDLPGGLQIRALSDAARAQGLQQGDILLSLGGHRLESNQALYQVLFTYGIGTTLTAQLFRDGDTLSLELTIFDTAE